VWSNGENHFNQHASAIFAELAAFISPQYMKNVFLETCRTKAQVLQTARVQGSIVESDGSKTEERRSQSWALSQIMTIGSREIDLIGMNSMILYFL